MKSICFLLVVAIAQLSFAQNKNSADDSLLIGTWKGTSICQVKFSPCNDEIAVYHISKAERPGYYHMVMNKLVNGSEEDMGVNEYQYNIATKTLSCFDQARGITWTFVLNGEAMEGKLVFKNAVYRLIQVKKISGIK